MFSTLSASEKRARFREGLRSGKLLRLPGAFSPYVAKLVGRRKFDGIYISGAGLAADLGLPDIGLITMTEVVARGGAIARTTDLPAIIDIDTGFGEPLNAARTIYELENAGLTGFHLEDQENPKRCGHLDGKAIVSTEAMVRKLKAAVDTRRDENFTIIARTDSRAVEGLDAAIERCRAYVAAGADMIFPEALQGLEEFEAVRKAISVPLLANITEFGKTPLLDANALEGIGYNVAIYPMTLYRLAMKAVENGLDALEQTGTQAGVIDQMQHRTELYDVLEYERFTAFDQAIFDIGEHAHSRR